MRDAIVATGVGKKFRQAKRGHATTWRERWHAAWPFGQPEEGFWALRDVTFQVSPGTAVGVLGRNGAGKSTLLQIIGGVMRASEGQVSVRGQVGGFLNFMVGFHPDLTGRENVYAAGVIAGLTRAEVRQRFDSIVDFAEVEGFIDSPVRTFSSGMRTRLAFAVTAHAFPDILLMDEVLAVGDVPFRQKCLERIGQFKEQGCTIVLVSHEAAQIRDFCDEALWLSSGRLVAHGDAGTVAEQYAGQMKVETRSRTPADHPTVRASSGVELEMNRNRFGSLELEITGVRMCDGDGRTTEVLHTGDVLHVEIRYVAHEPIQSPIVGVRIVSEDEQLCCATSSNADGLHLPEVSGPGQVTVTFRRLDLNRGRYFVDVGAYERNWEFTYDYHRRAYALDVLSEGKKKDGVLRPPIIWRRDEPSDGQVHDTSDTATGNAAT